MTAASDRPPRFMPNPVGLNADFYGWCARGELRFQRCDTCGVWRHPPRHLCAACGSESVSWVASSGRGRVYSWTVTHQALDPAFETPYAVLVVEMEEGPRVVGNLRGMEPAALALDVVVRAEIEVVSETVGLLHFRPT